MIRLLLAALAIAMPIAAMAADKGGPPTRVDEAGNEKPLFSGCYVDAGGRVWSDVGATKGVELGAGCDLQTGRYVTGGAIKYALGENDLRAFTITPRMGIALNPHTLAYAKMDYTVNGRTFRFTEGMLSVGAGLETYLDKKLSIYIEAGQSLKKFGTTDDTTTYTFGGGLRWRF